MRRYYGEMGILTLVGLPIGLASGAFAALFGRVLLWVSDVRDGHLLWFVPFLAVAGLLIVWGYAKFGDNAGKGMVLIFNAGNGASENIPKRLIPLVMIATWLTHLFGGSAGREGVSVQIGAATADTIGKWLRLELNRKTLIVMGMAAGFAGLFQTPLAATLFAIEVLVIGRVATQVIFPVLVGALVASWTSHALGLEKFAFQVAVDVTLDWRTIGTGLVLGLAFGLVGLAFSSLLAWAKGKAAAWLPNPYARIAVGGAIVSAFVLLLHFGRYAGLGTNLINTALAGQTVYTYDFVLKLLLTVLTLAVGFQGGEVTPLFAIGASLGAVLAPLVGLPVALSAGLGYAAVFGSATNTFFAPIFIGAEVFGFSIVPLLTVVMATAYFVNFNKSIYGGQLLPKD